jgi:hypothetical protein
MDAISILNNISWEINKDVDTARYMSREDEHSFRAITQAEWDTKMDVPEYRKTGIILYMGYALVTDVDDEFVGDFARVTADASVRQILLAIKAMVDNRPPNTYLRRKYFEGITAPLYRAEEIIKKVRATFYNNVFEILNGS